MTWSGSAARGISIGTRTRARTPARGPPRRQGLKTGAISFISGIVIAVASTAPGYSLAATLGFIVAIEGIGLQAPAVILVAFIPMGCIAAAYNYLNRADPDCGTTFSWVTRAMGPRIGWMSGWAVIVADVLVMPSLAGDRRRSTPASCSATTTRRLTVIRVRSASPGSW